MGCPGQCVYCAQDKQTGKVPPLGSPLLGDVSPRLEALPPCDLGETRELAFYGGTFTALPRRERRLCLDFLARMKNEGRITHCRCSTRPDALSPFILEELKDYGIDLIELGIQSFDDEALALSRRGYSGEEASQGCRTVLEAGFKLGIQLLPGMPGNSPSVFLEDVKHALGLAPACMRFYPCLVPNGTILANWFLEKRYQPWSLEETVQTLGRALQLAWKAGIPVIRLSVAPEPAFDAALLGGPRHPALGALIQAEALLLSVEDAARRLGKSPESLLLPRSCQGFMYGDHGSLKPRWRALGLYPERIRFHENSRAELS